MTEFQVDDVARLPLRITKPQASSTQRGYGREHIMAGEAWHLDHTTDRSGYRGAAHRICNLRDAQRRSAVTMVANYYGIDRAEVVAWLESRSQCRSA